jgi:hypothetical protein
MKKERNFKVKFHNIDLPTTVYLVNAESHYELYERFGGIIMNRGYYHTKATWRAYSSKIPTIAELKKIAFRRLVNKRNIRTYYFYPSSNTRSSYGSYTVKIILIGIIAIAIMLEAAKLLDERG